MTLLTRTEFISHPFPSLSHPSLKIGPWLQYWPHPHQRLPMIPVPLMGMFLIFRYHLRNMVMQWRLKVLPNTIM